MRVKFDDDAPIAMRAKASTAVSQSLVFIDAEGMKARLSSALKIVVRAKMAGEWKDLEFSPASGIDTAKFAEATARQAKSKSCEQNALQVNYTECMQRD